MLPKLRKIVKARFSLALDIVCRGKLPFFSQRYKYISFFTFSRIAFEIFLVDFFM
jgi:hypothetical protein